MSTPLDPTGELRELASDCVHCGFCLPACPTYELWGEEMDSPRGRIHLITQLLDGSPGTAAAGLHLDRCLGCMACVPACPSGVRYDRLITAARSWQEDPPPAAVPAAPPESAPSSSVTSPSPLASSSTPATSATSATSGTPATLAALPARSRRDRATRAAIFATFPYPRRLRPCWRRCGRRRRPGWRGGWPAARWRPG